MVYGGGEPSCSLFNGRQDSKDGKATPLCAEGVWKST
jgi:hypothetical protein